MTRRNPHSESNRLTSREIELSGLSVVPVASAPDQSSGELATAVEVATDTRRSEHTAVAVLTGAHGSAYVPPEGSRVAYAPRSGSRDGGLVAGAVYQDSITLPALKPGERVVSHPLSDAQVFFRADGTVAIDGDTDVVVNGGSTKAIEDVSVSTQKDGDGHVTDVSLNISRANNVYL